MKLYITLGILCMVISEVVAHRCYQCTNETSSSCYNRSCPAYSLCASRTEVDYENGTRTETSERMCMDTYYYYGCITGSINMGLYKKTMNTECCKTDLCNSEIAPEYNVSDTNNGYQCYTCEGDNCTHMMSCVGNQYGCITARNWTHNNMTLKGCASTSLCYYVQRMESGITCCYGNLCNGDRSPYPIWTTPDYGCDDIFCSSAKSVGQSVLLMFGSLLSILFFH